ncbi:MAG: 50S ribosomal protein L21 [Chlamydiia bacterium]|nr:50S ribosomal protein L21 [Chlamydiia bacterium]
MTDKKSYAVIQTGGKQYRVFEGDVIEVELLSGEKTSSVEFHEIVFLFDGTTPHVGQPIVGNVVKGEILGNLRGDKVVSYKYKRRKNYHRKVGHRQNYTQVKITEIGGK